MDGWTAAFDAAAAAVAAVAISMVFGLFLYSISDRAVGTTLKMICDYRE